ncbi:hypothetical protein ABBQ38_005149 [Trebouxia sp. C0009 RCD-2024]
MEPDDSEPKLPIVHKIGKYEVLSHQIGEGGFCCVYPCQHSSSSKTQVAMKLSLKRVEDCENDAKWTATKREWQMYQSMAFGRSQDSQRSGIPAVYECGFVQTSKGIHSWMSMQLLGPDLRFLANKKLIPRTTHFIPYATAMLAALQYVHKHGIVHNDVKPANFCLAAGTIQATSKVYIVDFGLATAAPNTDYARLDMNYMRSGFQGTPDYASTDALNDVRCSAKDDLESLGYAFLEMFIGDLLWDLCKDRPYEGGNYFSKAQLRTMARLRDKQWEESSAKGEIPTFLITWRRYVRSLKAFEAPSYAWLFRLIQHSQDKPVAHGPTKHQREAAAEDEHSAKRVKITCEE